MSKKKILKAILMALTVLLTAAQSNDGKEELNNYTRDGIKARLIALGARPVSKVSKRTDYLILGERPGNKLLKAQTLGITILSEREFEVLTG